MNKRTAMQWIVDEVDELTTAGVLTVESGDALRRHYQKKLGEESSGGRVVLLSVLGATLIGAGVILLVAHNWDDLGRPVRTALSLLPLLVALAISFWTLLRRPGSVAWRESAGVGQSAGVAASIALVSQTYHISGDLSGFMWIWMLLLVPMPYLLQSVMAAIIYLAGIAVWAGASLALDFRGSADGYWLFLLAILPFYASVVRRDRLGKSASWISVILGLSAAFGLGFNFWNTAHDIWIPAFSGFFSVLYLSGGLAFPERRHHPLRTLGALGIVAMLLILSFKDAWPGTHPWNPPSETRWIETVLAVAFPLAALGLMAQAAWRKADINWFAAGFAVAGLVAYGFAECSSTVAGAIFFNIYGFVLALGTALRGMQQRAIPTLNGGLLILAALVISRFSDSGFSILARGVAFIVLGVILLAANLWMLKQKREVRA